MSLVTACHPSAVEGVSYLAADFRVPCFDVVHISSLVLSSCVLVLLALGLPAFIFSKTRRLLQKKSKFDFLFGKYRFPSKPMVSLLVHVSSWVRFEALRVVGSPHSHAKSCHAVRRHLGVRLVCSRWSFVWPCVRLLHTPPFPS